MGICRVLERAAPRGARSRLWRFELDYEAARGSERLRHFARSRFDLLQRSEFFPCRLEQTKVDRLSERIRPSLEGMV